MIKTLIAEIDFYQFRYLIIELLFGVCSLLYGIKAKKNTEKRQAGILLILMALCAFILCIIEMVNKTSDIAASIKSTIRTIQLVVGGVWLGFYLVMLIFGYFKLLKKSGTVGNQ